MDLGIQLTVMAGPTVPLPLPPPLVARLVSVSAVETDSDQPRAGDQAGGAARSGFSITFDAGRSGPAELMDVPLLAYPGLRTGSRVSIVVIKNAMPQVLADGFITQIEHKPGAGGGNATLVFTGEDVSWLLDKTEVTRESPMDDYPQVLMILGSYAAQGVIPMAIPPAVMDPPIPIERVPQQRGTDYAHLINLAERHGYITSAMPGPAPGTSTFYWGPPVRAGVPQPAITVGQLPSTNIIGDLTFSLNAHAPVAVQGRDTDRRTGVTIPIRTLPPMRIPLAAMPLALVRAADTRLRLTTRSGSSAVGTMAQAQAEVDAGADVVQAAGTLDGSRYSGVLRPRGLVGVRGSGWSHDGLWYVSRVEHTWSRGSWTQAFTLLRDGYGSTVPAVIP